MDERVFIGVGSNMGDGFRHCAEAVKRMLADSRGKFVALSSFYTTSPVSPVPQDDFANCALALTWSASPADLLLLLNRIEADMGRIRVIPLGPRMIDLDILLFGETVVHTPALTIPHPELHRRRFALVPCIEIDPSVIHPVYNRPLASFLDHIDPSQELSVALSARDALALAFSPTGEGRHK